MENLLERAAEKQRFLLMSVVNWGEVYYSVWRTHGEDAANEKLKQIALAALKGEPSALKALLEDRKRERTL